MASKHIKDHRKEKELFLNRTIISILVGLLLISVVLIRLYQLQVVENEFFVEKAHGNRINIRATLPPRGIIYDRNGRILAENKTAFQLELIPEQVKDIDDSLMRLSSLGLIDNESINSITGPVIEMKKQFMNEKIKAINKLESEALIKRKELSNQINTIVDELDNNNKVISDRMNQLNDDAEYTATIIKSINKIKIKDII